MIHSLEGIPEGNHRDYFIYLLDYGWKEPLSAALYANFDNMARLSSEHQNSVVIKAIGEGIHFSDQVFSWHSIDGQSTEANNLLPAILLTNRHPAEFKKRAQEAKINTEKNLKLILFPLKEYCEDTSDVVELIQKIFSNIQQGKDLSNFGIKPIKKNSLVSSMVIVPSNGGTSISLRTIDHFFGDK